MLCLSVKVFIIFLVLDKYKCFVVRPKSPLTTPSLHRVYHPNPSRYIKHSTSLNLIPEKSKDEKGGIFNVESEKSWMNMLTTVLAAVFLTWQMNSMSAQMNSMSAENKKSFEMVKVDIDRRFDMVKVDIADMKSDIKNINTRFDGLRSRFDGIAFGVGGVVAVFSGLGGITNFFDWVEKQQDKAKERNAKIEQEDKKGKYR